MPLRQSRPWTVWTLGAGTSRSTKPVSVRLEAEEAAVAVAATEAAVAVVAVVEAVGATAAEAVAAVVVGTEAAVVAGRTAGAGRKRGCAEMAIRVTSMSGRDGEKLLQRFKRLTIREGLIKEIKRRRFYEKPSTRRRREANERIRAVRKAQRRKELGLPPRSGTPRD